MPEIKYMKWVEKLAQKLPVFTTRDMTARGVPPSYVRRLGNYLVKEKGVTRLERGKFTTLTDPLLGASWMVFPSYLSMTTALHLRGVLLQVPHEIQVITTRKRKEKKTKVMGADVNFFRVGKKLFFGYTYMEYQSHQLPIAEPEKALVDLAYFGFEPEGKLMLEKLNMKKLEAYVNMVGSDAVKKRVKRWANVTME